MNIFNLEDKEFEKAINDMLDSMLADELLRELIENGLELNDE